MAALIKKRLLTQHRAELVGAALGVAACVVPAGFLAIVVGGNFGGAYLGKAAEALSFPATPFTLVGVALGFLAVFVLVTGLAALCGRFLGRAAWKVLSHDV